MDGLNEVLLKGGPVALILAIAIALKYAAEGIRSWFDGRKSPPETPAPVADAATTNALLLDALRTERADNARKDDRIDELEQEVDDLREQLWSQRRTYEVEIGELRSKLQDITIQLEGLQARITAGLPEHP